MCVSSNGMLRRYPVDRPLHLPPGKPGAALRLWVVGTAQLRNFTCNTILDCFFAPDKVRALQPHLGIQAKPVKALGRLFHKILPLDVKGFGERNLPFAQSFVFTIVLNHEQLHFILRVVRDDDL
ncbi:hypothetical protein D3C78_1383450 [compost metagenome]